MSETDKALQRARRREREAQKQMATAEAERVLKARLDAQLADATDAIERLRTTLRQHRIQEVAHGDLSDHANGFYEEIDKLAKGKALLEVTDLMVDRANEIIRDAKAITTGDQFLDRLREFVPAGNNPVYPDVVVSIRTVLQALGRAKERSINRRRGLEAKVREAATIQAALQLLVDGNGVPTKEDVKQFVVSGEVADIWFDYSEDEEQDSFALGRLDRLDLRQYLSADNIEP